MNENNENYISPQIAVYKTDKKLVEFNDKLRTAPIESYAHIHSLGDITNNEGRKITSLIGITMVDYTHGTGKNAVIVRANISPDEAKYFFNRLSIGFQNFEYKQDKIFGDADEKGLSQVTKLRLVRATTGSDGKPRNYPWYMEIENGLGIKVKNSTGGSYMKSNSFVSSNKVFVNLSDADLFKLLNRVSSYIDAWEVAIAPMLITKAKKAIQQNAS